MALRPRGNPPTRVAEEMAMLDVILGGRLIAGFPVGTSMDTNYAFENYLQETKDLKAAAKFLWPIPDTGHQQAFAADCGEDTCCDRGR